MKEVTIKRHTITVSIDDLREFIGIPEGMGMPYINNTDLNEINGTLTFTWEAVIDG